MPQPTKIFRVFVSSTFNDMKVERRLLREKVFPFLEQFCRERGARFQAIDLRWGVSEESQRDQKTMQICLNEIRRCQNLSPRPNFLILLGNRYGWQPIPSAIPQKEMDQIQSFIPPVFMELVEEWYRLDENAVPAEYVLQPWGERIKEYQEWEPVETQLRMVLRDAAKKANLAQQAQLKYTTSATHQEILAGALDPPPDVARPESHVLALSRTISNLPSGEQAMDYLDFVQGTPDPYSQTQLGQLRKDLQTKLKKEHYIEYSANWVKEAIVLEDEQYFIDKIIQHLQSVIESELQQRADEDEIEREARYHEEFAKSLTTYFTGRKDSLDRIREYLDNKNNQQVLALVGASGSGKTCLMSRAILDAKERNAVLVYRFIGANAGSSNIVHLLSSVCREIAQAFRTDLQSLLDDAQKGLYLDINLLIPLFRKCLELANPAKPLILFLDALDQLSDSDNAGELRWLPRELAPHVHLVVSSLPRLEGALHDTEVYHLPMMPGKEGEHLLETWLSAQGRTLTDIQKQILLAKFKTNGLPLFLKLAFEQARKWCSYSKPTNLPDDVPALIEQFVSALETEHSPALVSTAVGYLLSGKNRGLTEDEILDMLVWDEDYWRYFLQHSHPAHRDEIKEAKKLPVVIWSRLFLDLAPYLTERDSYDERIIGFYHRQFDEILRLKYLQDEKHRHRRLAKYLAVGPHFFDGDEQKQPNVRKCVELPWQQTQGEMWDEVTETLCDLDFIQAKAVAQMTYELVQDFDAALGVIPENAERIRQERDRQARLEKYIHDLIAYAKGEIDVLEVPKSVTPGSQEKIEAEIKRLISGPTRVDRLRDFVNLVGQEAENLQQHAPQTLNDLIAYVKRKVANLEVPESVEPWPQEKIEAEIERIKSDPSRADRLQDFINFLGQEAGNLQHYAPQLHGFAIQQAWNHADSGPVGNAAAVSVGKKTWAGQNHLLLSKTPTRPPWNPLPQAIKILKGHTGYVLAVSVTPDGKRAVSGSVDKTCILWNLDTGQPIKTLIGHTAGVSAVSVTPDGKRAISGSFDNTCILWDLDTGQLIKTLKGHTSYVTAVSVTPDCKRAVSGSEDNTCILWDLDTGQPSKTLRGHTREVTAVSVTPDGKRAISGSWDNTCILWDLDTGQPSKTLKGHTSYVTAVSVTPDGKRAISGSGDDTCILWDLDTGQPIKTLKGHTSFVNSVSVTPDAKHAISGSGDRTCILWDLDTGQAIKTLKGHTSIVNAVSVTPDAKRAISGSEDNTCILWDLDTGQPSKTLKGHTREVTAVSVTPDGKRAISGSWDKICILWDLDTGQPSKTLIGHTKGVTAVSVTPDGKRAISGSEDNTCILWDLDTGQPIKTLKGHTNWVWAMRVSVTPDAKCAISSSDDNTCILWDLDTGQPSKTLKGHTREVTAVSVTPDGKRAISGSLDKTCILWDLDTGQPSKTLKGHTSYVTAVSVTPDTKRAISGSGDNTCILWDLDTGQPIKTLKGHTSYVTVVSVTPDAKRAISGSSDNTCILWDLESGQPIKTLKGHTRSVRAVSVTPDAKRAISGSEGNICILWDLYTGSALARFVGKSSVRCAAPYPAGVFVGMNSGEITILAASRESLCPEPGRTTARHIWDFDLHHYLDLSADCPFCGTRFAPEKIILETIRAIYRSSGLGPSDSPCLSMPKECWEEPRLLSTCPKCKEALRFNPFIVDPEGMSL